MAEEGNWIEHPSGLKILDIEVGEGKEAAPGDVATAHYTLWLESGEMLQTSVGGDPFSFTIGAGQVIRGWDIGVPGMRAGGKRKLIIPADLAYGDNPRPGSGIPPGATLTFEIELVRLN